MRYVIVDLEATCWETGTRPDRQEIIEIGAVLMPGPDQPPEREFAQFVKPVIEPELSAFCTQLTTITQADVADAPTFPTAFAAFRAWIGDEPYTLCSWGFYDVKQFRVDCARHEVEFPPAFERHINVKVTFAEQRSLRPGGMAAALRLLGLPLDGTHHRAIDDARNIARIAREVLPYVDVR